MTTEEKCTAIRQYCMDNVLPKQELCPRVVQFWKAKDVRMYWDSKTGKRTDYLPCDYSWRATVSVRSEYYGFYVEYIPSLGALELSSVRLDGGRGKDGEVKLWQYAKDGYGEPRLFLFKGDKSVYDANGYDTPADKKYVNSKMIDHLKDISNLPVNDNALFNVNAFAGQNIKDYFQYNYYAGYAIERWYNNFFIARTQSKQNFLLDYKLADEEITSDEYEVVMTYSKLDENYCVLRVYRCSCWDYYSNCSRPGSRYNEVGRCFISSKGKPTTAHMIGGKWVIKPSEIWQARSSHKTFLNKDEAMEWMPLKYILPIMDNPGLYDIIAMLRHPVVEQLTKAGFPKIAKRITRQHQVGANLKYYFNCEREKKLPLFKLLGVNKEEMRIEEEMSNNEGSFYGCSNFIKAIKQLYNRYDISDLSKETLELLRFGFEKSGHDFYDLANTDGGYHWYRYRQEYTYTEDDLKTILKLCRAERKHEGTIELYKDTNNMYNRISEVNRPEIEVIKFDNYDDLVRMHDAFIQIVAIDEMEKAARYDPDEKKRVEQMEKAFKKLQDKRIEKFNYDEENSEFCIRVPMELKDITIEGLKLSHCVKQYTMKHAYGDTNIIFLRKKNEENESFYTIEICNNCLRQIHGNHNKWLGNNPEAIPFVYRYLMHLGVKFDKKILLNKGMGYGASLECLPESYLTAA